MVCLGKSKLSFKYISILATEREGLVNTAPKVPDRTNSCYQNEFREHDPEHTDCILEATYANFGQIKQTSIPLTTAISPCKVPDLHSGAIKLAKRRRYFSRLADNFYKEPLVANTDDNSAKVKQMFFFFPRQ